jgi:hypothetical protein
VRKREEIAALGGDLVDPFALLGLLPLGALLGDLLLAFGNLALELVEHLLRFWKGEKQRFVF